ncbi:uncharacterized protein LACBIDRAFT_321336 [Laccaria bicolor S238N-H82]|uniref:Predicted protein n=1 Tax=Laccaria bicolor (strain S238N-H82 / ATCC MYA-4686) TaxID=486041 RepID=B0CPM7_LACBS|nr:uncharacterized protein LACBIDRAFT_321336 [Laccaria bicolor S238N-H82]EDR16121.1 predicted protein [Laccaria bicolor S238N-H82]|eukprot:XP_001874329.1 predicted protein [Laccaria bicolor S238N-H82]
MDLYLLDTLVFNKIHSQPCMYLQMLWYIAYLRFWQTKVIHGWEEFFIWVYQGPVKDCTIFAKAQVNPKSTHIWTQLMDSDLSLVLQQGYGHPRQQCRASQLPLAAQEFHATSLASVSYPVRQVMIPFSLHTVVLHPTSNIHAFINTLRLQDEYSQVSDNTQMSEYCGAYWNLHILMPHLPLRALLLCQRCSPMVSDAAPWSAMQPHGQRCSPMVICSPPSFAAAPHTSPSAVLRPTLTLRIWSSCPFVALLTLHTTCPRHYASNHFNINPATMLTSSARDLFTFGDDSVPVCTTDGDHKLKHPVFWHSTYFQIVQGEMPLCFFAVGVHLYME